MMFGFVLIVFFLLFLLTFLLKKNKNLVHDSLSLEVILPILNHSMPFYHSLDEKEKELFITKVDFFISRHPIIGIGFDPELKDKILIASSLVSMLFKSNLELDNLIHSIYLSKGLFEGIIYGLPRKASGFVKQKRTGFDIYLSKDYLRNGYANLKDNKNVAYHEFAHIIDGADGKIDGVPLYLLSEEELLLWHKLANKYMKKINGNGTVIDQYAKQNKAEFFAVVSEYFFENPFQLQELYPDLYVFLSKIFNNDLKKGYQSNFK